MEGLRAILAQAHDNEGATNKDVLHSWTPSSMARRMRSAQSTTTCRILVGSNDKIAHPSQALRLAKILHRSNDDAALEEDDDVDVSDIYEVVDGCGHSVPMEAMRVWREDVVQFLNK